MAKTPSLKVRHKKAPNFDIKGVTDGEPVVPRPWEVDSKKKGVRRLSKKAKDALASQAQLLAGHSALSDNLSDMEEETPSLVPVKKAAKPSHRKKSNKAQKKTVPDSKKESASKTGGVPEKTPQVEASAPIQEDTPSFLELDPEKPEDSDDRSQVLHPIPEAIQSCADQNFIDLTQLPRLRSVRRYIDMRDLYEACVLHDHYAALGLKNYHDGDPLGLAVELDTQEENTEQVDANESTHETVFLHDHDQFLESKREATEALGLYQQLCRDNREAHLAALVERLPKEVRQEGVIWAEELAEELYVANEVDRKAVIEKALSNFPTDDPNAMDVARRWLLGNFVALNDLNALFPSNGRLEWLDFPHHRTTLLDPLADYKARIEDFKEQVVAEDTPMRITSPDCNDEDTTKSLEANDAPPGPTSSSSEKPSDELKAKEDPEKEEGPTSKKSDTPTHSSDCKFELFDQAHLEKFRKLGEKALEEIQTFIKSLSGDKVKNWVLALFKQEPLSHKEDAMNDEQTKTSFLSEFIQRIKQNFVKSDRITLAIWGLTGVIALGLLVHWLMAPLPLYYVDMHEIEQIAIEAQVVAKAFPEEKDLQCPSIDKDKIDSTIKEISDRYQIPIFDVQEIARFQGNDKVKVKNITKAVLKKLGLPPQKVSLANERFTHLMSEQ